jgi:hypothetical protein
MSHESEKVKKNKRLATFRQSQRDGVARRHVVPEVIADG